MKSQVYRNGQTAYIGNLSRTKFVKPLKSVKTSMTVGKLYPVRWEEVLPGTNWKSDTSFTATLTSAYLRPVKDDLFIDHYTFFVPLRLLYDDYERVFGNSSPSAYDEDSDLGAFPSFDKQVDIFPKSVGDYLGLPVGKIPPGVSVLPFRAFALIRDEWFRNQNVDDGVLLQTGELSVDETPNSSPWGPRNYVGLLPNVTKLKDYFTVAVPSPQKGSAVNIGSFSGFVPLSSENRMHTLQVPLKFSHSDSSAPTEPSYSVLRVGNQAAGRAVVADFTDSTQPNSSASINATNLGIQAGHLYSINVNDLRMAVALQRMQEIDIFGGRYREYLLAHFNVNNGDARMQVPEFLGGKRCPLFNQTVAQTSQGTQASPLAALAGFSETADSRGGSFSKAFTEHGYLMTVACIRQRHTYQQGIQVKWTRTERNDFYDPCFAHIGNQPIWQSELYAINKTNLKDNVFGYKEAWSEYKQSFNEVSGQARSSSQESLDLYHFADDFANAPVLSKGFIDETDKYVSRTLAVSPESQDPFFVDWCFRDVVTLPIPLNCDPGLLDHRG